jgi:hypothetical protein
MWSPSRELVFHHYLAVRRTGPKIMGRKLSGTKHICRRRKKIEDGGRYVLGYRNLTAR